MERIMSVEDKIRRAEEIYNRRRENEYRVSTTRVSVDNNKNRENTFINKIIYYDLYKDYQYYKNIYIKVKDNINKNFFFISYS